MKEIQYFRASENDATTLADLRIAFLTELMGAQSSDDIKLLRQNLLTYFKEALASGTCICWLASADNIIAGVGLMTIRVQPGNFRNPSGRMGYVLNMYTVAGYRRRGIGSKLLTLLTDSGQEMGVTAFELHATPDGEPVYLKNNFKLHTEPTYRKYC